jgi:hypothetical protein
VAFLCEPCVFFEDDGAGELLVEDVELRVQELASVPVGAVRCRVELSAQLSLVVRRQVHFLN